MSILGPVRSSGKMCTLHRSLFVTKMCIAPLQVRSWRFMWTRGSSKGPTAEKRHACLPLWSMVPPAIRRVTCNCWKILHGRDVDLRIKSWYATVTLCCSDASDNASNHLLKFQNRVLRCGSSMLWINLDPYTAPSISRARGLCRRKYSVLSSKSASDCGRVAVKSGKVAWPSFHRNDWWSSLWRCSFRLDCCLVNYGLLSLITW